MAEDQIATPTNAAAIEAAVYNATPLSTSPIPTKATCCFPGFFFRKKRNCKQVRFASARGISGNLKKTKSVVGKHHLMSSCSPSKKSFYSAVSKFTNHEDLVRSSPSTTAEIGDETDRSGSICPCAFRAHSQFDPQYPLVIPPNVEPGSQGELMIHAKAMLGRWVTLLDRSDSLDEQMVYVGIGKMKRMVMNRLAIPLGAELVDNDETLKVWIETPVGNKATHASLVGKETFDADGDLGDWTAKTCITDFHIPQFCQGREFRALQMERHNPKLGVAHETKAVLPDSEHGKILLYNITITPPNNGKVISVNRFYRPEAQRIV